MNDPTLSLCFLCPVLGRPQNVEPTVTSFFDSVRVEEREGWKLTILFLCSTGDTAEIAAVEKSGCDHLLVAGGRCEYARKINAGALHTDATWLFTGADDLAFQPGWLHEAINVHITTGALVIGTQDQGNQLVKQGLHATHSLVHRSYLEQGTIDEPGLLLHEEYDHNAVDVEFTETAMFREVWAFADRSVVRHDHPLWSRGKVKRDAVYNKGIRNARQDRALLRSRRHLWGGPVSSEPLKRPWPVQSAATGRRRQAARWPPR